MIIIYPFQTQEVRDLARACFSPPLMYLGPMAGQGAGTSDCVFELTAQRRLWLEALDRDASPLLAHLAQKPSHRLGIYFEQLWQFFLKHEPEVDLVVSNLPVHDQGRTLGEFDCIYFCQRRQRHVHLELAVKYFLGAPGSDPAENDSTARAWLGPDTKDRLDKKIDHILHRQILLGENPTARKCLIELGIEQPLKEIAFRGQLFQPWKNALPPPGGYNNNHPFSEWVHYDRLHAYLHSSLHTGLQTTDAATFEILPKMRWLSTAHTTVTSKTLSAEQLISELDKYFKRDSYPLLIAAMDDLGQESHRFFVTANDWPLGNEGTAPDTTVK